MANLLINSVADLRGVRGTRATPGGPNSFNFMQFWENFAKSYVGNPSSGKSWIRHCNLSMRLRASMLCNSNVVMLHFLVYNGYKTIPLCVALRLCTLTVLSSVQAVDTDTDAGFRLDDVIVVPDRPHALTEP